jgi:hypothetical protein
MVLRGSSKRAIGPEQSGLVFWPMSASACFATFGGRHEYFCVSETPAFSQPDTSAPVVGSAETAYAAGQDQRGIRAAQRHPRIRLCEGGLSRWVEHRLPEKAAPFEDAPLDASRSAGFSIFKALKAKCNESLLW